MAALRRGAYNLAMDATLWAEMFHLHLPVLEKVLRPILVYGFLVLGLRLAGSGSWRS